MSTTGGKKFLVPLLAALLVVAVGVIGYLLVRSGSPKQAEAATRVPDVEWLERHDAEKIIVNAGFSVGEEKLESNDEVPKGQVISQKPTAYTTADEGTAVSLVISAGKAAPVMVTVPDLTGKTQEEAEQALADAQLVAVAGNPAYSSDVDPGKVCSQSVKAGTSVQEGSHVVFSISLGRETVAVPDVTGKPIDEARDTLTKAGLGTDTSSSYSDTVDKDKVISQSIAKDVRVVKGTVVTLELSLGPKPKEKVKVPDIMTYTLDDAKKALDSAGLTYRYTGEADGTVVAMNPAAGTEVDEGSTVYFTLQHHASLVAVPDMAGKTGAEASAECKQAGLVLDYDTSDPDKTLTGSDPVAGTMVEIGSTVTAVYDPEPAPSPDPVAGGWQVNTEAAPRVSADEQAVFENAMASSNDAAAKSAKPIAVMATQVVAGTNYAFLGYADSSWYVFTVYEDLQGNASLTSAKAIDLADVKATDEAAQQLAGGWTVWNDETGTLAPDEVQKAFDGALSSWTGVSLDPIAYLGSQVVKGANYKVLCAGSAVTPDATLQLYVATVYADADGSASFSDVSTFDLNAYVG